MVNNGSAGKLSLVGLGLYGADELTLKGLNVLRNSDIIFAEFYTSFLGLDFSIDRLENLLGKEINVLDRDEVESGIDDLLEEYKDSRISFITAGDPMVATTHTDLRVRAIDLGMDTQVVHAPSIYSAIAETGLQIYKFGKSTSVVFPQEDKNYFPTSYYDVIKQNKSSDLHSMVFLDIDSERGRYMSVDEAVDILLESEERRSDGILSLDTLAVGIARIGSDDSVIKAGYFKDLKNTDFGDPPHTLVLPGKLHHMEKEYLVKVCDGPKDLLEE